MPTATAKRRRARIDEEVKRILDESLAATAEILQTRKQALVALAKKLIEIESLEAAELADLIEQHSPGPQVVPGTGDKVKRPSHPPTTDDSASEGSIETG